MMKNLNWQLATHDENLAHVQTAVDTASAVGNQNAATTKPMFLFPLPVPSVKKKFKKGANLFSFRDNYATSPYQQETLWETIVALRGCDVKPMFVFPVSREIGALGADCDPFPD